MSSTRKRDTLNAVLRQGWLPIYVQDEYDSKLLVEAAVEAGCECIEYTIRRRDAAVMIPWVKKHYPRLRIFAATLVDGARAARHLSPRVANFLTVDQVADLGCDGLISFLGFRPETYARYGADLVTIPAVTTPQEALEQFERGATLVKIADPDKTPAKVRMLIAYTHGLLGTLITGGITPDKIAPYVEAGALLFAGGFDLYWKELGAQASKAQIVAKLRTHLDAVREARARFMPALAQAVARNETDLAATLGACMLQA